jgi:hypothetical protein
MNSNAALIGALSSGTPVLAQENTRFGARKCHLSARKYRAPASLDLGMEESDDRARLHHYI